jgi:hypothetical protein
MKITIRDEECFWVKTENTGLNTLISTTPEEKALTMQLNGSYKYVLKTKNNLHKMFILSSDEDVQNFDFGSWSEAKTVWQSF